MDVLLLVLGLVWSILVIILFFKIWSATNDIKKLKQVVAKEETLITNTPRYLYATGKIDECYEVLNKELFKHLYNVAQISYNADNFNKDDKPSILKRYEASYAKIGKEIPQGLRDITYHDLWNLYLRENQEDKNNQN